LTIWPSTRLLNGNHVERLDRADRVQEHRHVGDRDGAGGDRNPGPEGGRDWASALGAKLPMTRGITIAVTARIAVAAIAVSSHGGSLEALTDTECIL